MAWREASTVEQRFEFVTLASAEGANIAALCRRFGVSRETGYKWIARFKAGDKAGLRDQSRRPRSSPERTGEEIEAAVIALRDKHPAWGGRKLRARLLALGQEDVPAASTITAILRRHGRLDPAESGKHTAVRRFERERPNELWQMDFKGHVPMHVGGRCHPLTLLDDHSRFAVGLWACGDEQERTVRAHLIAIFRRYGLPERMLTDNGPPWGVGSAPGRHTRLTVWLLRLGVRISHGRPRHPQTQGKDERFHRTLNAELLTRQDLRDMPHAQGLFDGWREVYNLERPNEAIGLATPASRYRPSERVYPEQLPEVEFSPDDTVRRVRHDGSFNFAGRVWFIGEAFARENVGVRRTAEGAIEARYGPHVVGRFEPPDPAPDRAPRCPRVALGLAALALAPPAGNADNSDCQ
jgi:transposase InsO family protein